MLTGDLHGPLSEEQAALRRVATMVAQGVPHEQLFSLVTEEVGRLFSVEYTELGRYESAGTVSIVGAWGGEGRHLAVGSRWTLGGTNLMTLVFETGHSARIDDYSRASGPLGAITLQRGTRSAVGSPVLVEGQLWGIVVAGSTMERPLPPETEERLASFTELVATAIANAEARARLTQLAEEQAALRRVATLVAAGTPPEALFAALTVEIGSLLPVQYVYMARYEPDRTIRVVASWGKVSSGFLAGTQWAAEGNNLVMKVFETGQPARVDSLDGATGAIGAAAREAGFRAAVGTPIIVDGGLWGVMVAGSTLEQPLAPDAEAQLASFTELLAMAIANADSRVALAGSRARIVAAADESRRRIERDLHDGAQQRLVHAVIVLKLAVVAVADGKPNALELVNEALSHAEQASSELRELAHGILPAALVRSGLRAGVESLLSRVSLPVRVDLRVDRMSDGIEATAYFVISEALTNVVKHAHATRAEVSAFIERDTLQIEIRDDGIGGARGGHGTGLGGLEDRVVALDGRFLVESPPGGGTRVLALLPLEPDGQA